MRRILIGPPGAPGLPGTPAAPGAGSYGATDPQEVAARVLSMLNG